MLQARSVPSRALTGQQRPFTSLRPRNVAVRCNLQTMGTMREPVTEQPMAGAQQAASASRRNIVQLAVMGTLAGLAQQLSTVQPANAITGNPLEYKKELARKRRKIPEDQFKDGPDGLKYYDVVVGTGAEPREGDRIAIHYDVKFRNVTFMTSRMGIGVTGGTPFGFDVGQPAGAPGSALPGIDLGVRGMKVGGQRRLLVPPNLAYGSKGVGEIPPNATLQIDVELLSIKSSPFGTRVKLVEG